MPKPRRALLCTSHLAAAVTLVCSAVALAGAGPPYLTNDPGTPGDGNWEINLAGAVTANERLSAWQVPQIDLNYGIGERVQLTYEIPYVIETVPGQAHQSGWSNSLPGIKWRFFDQGEGGWQMSTFPQVEPAGTAAARRNGIAQNGPRLLLPLEVAKTFGDYEFDFEAGYYFPHRGPSERIFGLVAGRPIGGGLELDAELYNDHVMGSGADATTLDVGGRYRLHRSLILLFMAGRSIAGSGVVSERYMGYLGFQILLTRYGTRLLSEP